MQDQARGLDLLKEIAGVSTEDVQRDRVFVNLYGISIPVMSLTHLPASKTFVGNDCGEAADVASIVFSSLCLVMRTQSPRIRSGR
jgi:hypothetical protein